MAREFFKMWHSYLEAIKPLSDAERGRLFTAMLQYSITGASPQLSGNERFLFPSMKFNLDKEIESYTQTVENGKKGGRPKKESQENQNDFGFFEKTGGNQEKNKNKNKNEEQDKYNPPTPFWGEERFRKVFQDFCSMRTRMKAPMTNRAKKMLITELDKLSGDMDTQIRILDQSILNGWKSVYPLEEKRPERKVRELE